MNLEDKKREVAWYDNANFVTNLIIVVLSLILIASQSLGGSSDLTAWELFKNVINPDSTAIRRDRDLFFQETIY